MTVKASLWKREPFTRGVPVPCTLSVSREEFRRIQEGLLPQDMEDKWFIDYEAPYQFWHRSWTGHPFYRLEWAVDDAGAHVTEMLWAAEAAEGDPEKQAFQGQIVDYLTSVLLLGKPKPLPRFSQGG